MAGLLAIFCPAVVIAAYLVRPPTSMPTGEPRESASSWEAEVEWETDTLRIQPIDTLLGASLLLYWAEGPDTVKLEAPLPDTCVFLGSFMQTEVTEITLPEGFKGGEGRLVLYSLVSQQVVDVSGPVSVGGRR